MCSRCRRLEYEHSMLAARSFAHSWFGILAAITLVGCASKPPEEANKPTVQTYAEDYRGLFQRVSTTAKRCFASKAGLYRSGETPLGGGRYALKETSVIFSVRLNS